MALTALIPVFHFYNLPQTPPAGSVPVVERMVIPRKSLNVVTPQELAALPGIGTKTAEVFLQARPQSGFASWDEVDAVKGVGPARLRLLQEHFELP